MILTLEPSSEYFCFEKNLSTVINIMNALLKYQIIILQLADISILAIAYTLIDYDSDWRF